MGSWKFCGVYTYKDQMSIDVRDVEIPDDMQDELQAVYDDLEEDVLDSYETLADFEMYVQDLYYEELGLDELDLDFTMCNCEVYDPNFTERLNVKYKDGYIKSDCRDQYMINNEGYVLVTVTNELLYTTEGHGMLLEAFNTIKIKVDSNWKIVEIDEPVVEVLEYGKPTGIEYLPSYYEIDRYFENIIENAE